jgi:hypothetical protein
MVPVLRSGLKPALLTGALLLGACAPSAPPLVPSPAPAGTEADTTGRIDLRVIYLIHGDGDYLYHDSAGRALRADEEALKQAVEVAEQDIRSEVFIFHQRPVVTRMFRDVPGGTFSQYRFGKLLRRQNYSSGSDARDFAAEAGLFQAHADDFAQPRRVLAYFGHEIPAHDRRNYSASRPERDFSIARFAQGLALWTRPTDGAAKPFDLVVLSTCYGGSPGMMTALAPLTDYALASPAYLHLSHLDTRALGKFPPDSSAPPDGGDVRRLADALALQSFYRLKARTQTEITVAVYDLEKTRPFLESPAARTAASAGNPKWRDCAARFRGEAGFNATSAAAGVTLYYNPPRFGPGKDVATRSGWQCPD